MIQIDNISKKYGETVAVNAVSATVEKGQIAALVGTSGSGKTTLLRMINRLVKPTAGRIFIDGKDTAKIKPHMLRRRIGYAIQGYGLFPHRTVSQNIASVPKLIGWRQNDIEARVDELLHLFHLPPEQFRNRMPHELSGGQQQRVGVARALAAQPDILLMDEPFGSLDPVIRAKAQADLLTIQKQLGMTLVIVTHDMKEAIMLGHRIAVMNKGELLQYGSARDILTKAANPFVESLVGLSDRPFRLLSLDKVADFMEPGEADGKPVSPQMNLRDALSECLWRNSRALAVEGGGIITRATIDARADGKYKGVA